MYKNIIEAYLPKYEPDIWNSDTNIRQSHNCYSYSLNDKYNQLGDLYENEDEMPKPPASRFWAWAPRAAGAFGHQGCLRL